MIAGMTRKIGVSLPDELYDWLTGQVSVGRADSVSALIASSVSLLRSRTLLQEIVDDLAAVLGEPDEDEKAQVEAALKAADEAQRRLLDRKLDGAA
jgi:Arc/MetJ-type ribon-helix-helix transcriptional regulator